MIDSRGFITDAQILGAFESGPMKFEARNTAPPSANERRAMVESLRVVAEYAVAAYISGGGKKLPMFIMSPDLGPLVGRTCSPDLLHRELPAGPCLLAIDRTMDHNTFRIEE